MVARNWLKPPWMVSPVSRTVCREIGKQWFFVKGLFQAVSETILTVASSVRAQEMFIHEFFFDS